MKLPIRAHEAFLRRILGCLGVVQDEVCRPEGAS
jgi:hypothetical protein